MNPLDFTIAQFHILLLIFFRVGGIIFSAPVFGSKNLPIQLKVGLALIISLILSSSVKVFTPDITRGIFPLVIALTGEMLIGVIIGFAVQVIFAAIQLAGQLVGFQMGFAIVNVLDPQTSNQISIVAQFQNILAMLIFLTVGAHHWFLRAVADSFTLVPPLGFNFSSGLINEIIRLSGNIFSVGVKIGAPMVAVLLFTSMALGVIARTVPQMNIFIVAFPIKITIGLLFLGLSLPLLNVLLTKLFNNLGNEFYLIFRLMG